MPRLARLSVEDRRFVELFILAGGSLKEVGRILSVSYPTVRNRLDKIISFLQAEIAVENEKADLGKGGTNHD